MPDARRSFILNVAAFITVTALSVCFILMLGNVSDPLGDGLKAHDNGNYQVALQLLRPLAEQGSAHAQLQLGMMYVWGHGVERNDAEAVKWFRASADQGLPPAQVTLGRMYVVGSGVTRDYVQAHMWFSIAATSQPGFDFQAAINARDRVAERMSPGEIAEAKRLADAWKPAAARPPAPARKEKP